MSDELNLPEIKPGASLLDPPQIRLTTNIVEDEGGSASDSADDKDLSNMQEIKEKKKPKKKLKISPPSFPKLRMSKKGRNILLAVLGVLTLLVVLVMVFVALPAYATYQKAQVLMARGEKLKASMQTQDINIVENEVRELKDELLDFESSLNRLLWMKSLPVVGPYMADSEAATKAGVYGIETAEIVIETAKPYADIIGFGGADSQQTSDAEESANDRIEFLVQTIGGIIPKMDQISQKANQANAELKKIDPNRYPEEFRGIKVRDKLKNGLILAEEATEMIANSKPLLEAAPYLIGVDDTRTYLLLFQNDKELRPTGGFLTAYSIVEVKDGKLNPVSSNDIYNLDAKYSPTIDAPKPIVDYIGGIYKASNNLRLRDMNWSPDFEESMKLFLEEADKAGIPEVDGIIAVDTHIAVALLDVIGPIGVPGFGNFSTEIVPECECPQVIYELESYADNEGPVVWDPVSGKIVFAPSNYYNRKDIVGPLMTSMMTNALGQPKEKMPALFEAGWNSLLNKHVLLYMLDEKAQQGITSFGIGGKVKDFDGDYLHVNDANLGGRKSNLYVTQEVTQDIEVQGDGSIVKTLSLTYKNPKEHDGWLNSMLPNWTRVYVPKGSELISVEGFEDQAEPYEELGKTVFSGGFELRPQGVKEIVIKYKLPFKAEEDYELFIQKQPGKDMPFYTINIGKQVEELFLKTDKEFRFKI
jgi:hypothetical protein